MIKKKLSDCECPECGGDLDYHSENFDATDGLGRVGGFEQAATCPQCGCECTFHYRLTGVTIDKEGVKDLHEKPVAAWENGERGE